LAFWFIPTDPPEWPVENETPQLSLTAPAAKFAIQEISDKKNFHLAELFSLSAHYQS
jgi:hypothetical protein